MRYIDELIKRYPALGAEKENIEKATEIIIGTFRSGGTLFLCGNGGSAADCAHIVGELRKAFVKKRPVNAEFAEKLKKYGEDGEYLAAHLEQGLPAVNLAAETSLSTAYINDNSAPAVFAQSLFGMAKKNDTLLTISTSGNSRNCILAAITARSMGIHTVTLTGKNGGKLADICDCAVKAPETETYKIQEYHLPIYHALCLECEETFFTE